MAITRIGSLSDFLGPYLDSTPRSLGSITVPSDAQVLVIGATGWSGAAGFWTGGTFRLGGSSGRVADLVCPGTDSSTSAFTGGLFAWDCRSYLGSQELYFATGGTGTINANDSHFIYGFYKGVNVSSMFRDSDGTSVPAGPPYTLSLTTVSGDLVVACGWAYTGGSPGTPTWDSPLTKVSDYLTPVGGCVASWAEGAATGSSTTAELNDTTNWDDGGMGALVLTSGGDGGRNPVAMGFVVQ